MLCRGKNKAVTICNSDDCDCGNRVFCKLPNCKACDIEETENIQCSRQSLAFINKYLNQRAREQNKFNQSIVEIENKAIVRLTKSQTEMLSRQHLADLEKSFLETVEQLYCGNGTSKIEGSQIKSLLQRLKRTTK